MAEIVTEQTPETLAEIIESVRPVYTGHPASEESPATEESTENPEEKLEFSPSPASEVDTEEDEETSVEEPVVEPEFKYKSQEEAEKAYKEAERLITDRAEEAKRERERAEDLQRQLIEALSKKADTQEKPKEEISVQPSSTERMQELLSAINQLDPGDDDYDKKVAGLWGQLDDERQATINAEIKTAIAEYDRQKQQQIERVQKEQSENDQIISDATKMATDEGLDMSDDSPDSELFWAFANLAPEGTIESQAKWTIDKVKNHKKPVIDRGKVKEVQEQNEVLERGGEKPPLKKKGPERPMTLHEAFEQIERRI